MRWALPLPTMKHMHCTQRNARPPRERRAYSLLELTAVVAIVGLMAGMAAIRFGHDTLSVTAAEGCVRQLAMSMKLARRQAITEGTPAAVVLTRASGEVESVGIFRVAGGGDVPTEAIVSVPTGVSVSAASDRWEFDYAGSLATPPAGGTVTVDAPGWQWSVTVNAATGHVGVTRAAN